VAENGGKGQSAVNLPRRVAISVADQSLLSLLNFVIGIWLIRSTSKLEYGLYLAGNAAVMYMLGIQAALINVQMTVRAPVYQGMERGRFCAALLKAQLLFFVVPALLFAAGAFVLAAGWGAYRDGMLLSGTVAMTFIGVLAREFFRSYFFQEQTPLAVLVIDIAYGVFLVLGVVVAGWTLHRNIHLAVLLAAGGASLIVGVVAARFAHLPSLQEAHGAKTAVTEAWQGGKWALAGMSVTWIQDQSYIILVGALAGASATAEAGAARLFLAPANLILAGIFRVLMPRWAHLRQSGEMLRVRSMIFKTALAVAGAVASYAIVAAVVQKKAIPVFFPGEYGNIGTLVIYWGIICALQAARTAYSSGLQVFERFREITIVNTFSAVIVLVSGYCLVYKYGVTGGLMAQVIGEFTLTALLWRSVRNVA
jgi:O-antigen/teichoic acid export membrane protein